MNHGKRSNQLILIENGRLTSYRLDNKTAWEIGRSSGENKPDIRLHSTTVSRKHGRFQNMDGVWFYLDHNGKNGTVYNHKHLDTGLGGRVKPVMLQDGDTFVFGGGEKEVINHKTIWGMFTETEYGDNWRAVDTKGYKCMTFTSGDTETTLSEPEKGTVIRREDGIAVYMGDLTYLTGDMRVSCVQDGA